jgi:hypothetical protein
VEPQMVIPFHGKQINSNAHIQVLRGLIGEGSEKA